MSCADSGFVGRYVMANTARQIKSHPVQHRNGLYSLVARVVAIRMMYGSIFALVAFLVPKKSHSNTGAVVY